MEKLMIYERIKKETKLIDKKRIRITQERSAIKRGEECEEIEN